MTTTPTNRDNPTTIDVLIAISVMRDEADLWEDVARNMGQSVSPIDAVHLCALTGIQAQLLKNDMPDEAATVGGMVERLATAMGVWPHQKGETATGGQDDATLHAE